MESFTRSEMLQVLSAMGVELPRTSKLSDDALGKRLRDALNFAQHKQYLPTSVDPLALPAWPWGQGLRSLSGAFVSANLQEAAENERLRRGGLALERPLFVDSFWDLRQTMSGIGAILSQGRKWWVVMDSAGQVFSINFRVLSILKVNAAMPGVIVVYRVFTSSDGEECVEWVNDNWQRNSNVRRGLPDQGASTIDASLLEAKLLLKLLAMNKKLLPSEYRPELERFERGFTASLLFPISPLGHQDLGSLNNDPGCIICGKAHKSRCSQCQSVSYCSVDCQRVHWPEHKNTCRSLSGGRWVTIPFRNAVPGGEGRLVSYMSVRAPTHALSLVKDTLPRPLPKTGDPPPANIHGHRTFLIKLQIPMVAGPVQHMMIYDRQRSLGYPGVYFIPADDQETFGECLKEARGPRSISGGLKMYRWAQRTGDFEMSVCLDRMPDTDIKW